MPQAARREDFIAMDRVVYVVDPDPEERSWIEATIAHEVAAVRAVDHAEALLAVLGARKGSCLVISVESDESSAVETLRELRLSGSMVPAIVIGPPTALRAATEIAKLQLTEFVDRPLTAHKLLSAIRRLREQERILSRA